VGAEVCCARASASLAASMLACAELTSSRTPVLSILASTWPAATWSPGLTSISVTVPPVLKLNPRLCAGCTVPAADDVSVTTPRCTRAVAATFARGVARSAYAKVAIPTAATTTTPTVSHRARVLMVRSLARPARCCLGRTSEEPQGFPANSEVGLTERRAGPAWMSP